MHSETFKTILCVTLSVKQYEATNNREKLESCIESEYYDAIVRIRFKNKDSLYGRILLHLRIKVQKFK